MPEPEPPPDEPLVLDYSRLWSLPPPLKAHLPIITLILLAAIVAVVVLALAAPLIRLGRDTASALFA